MPGHQLSAADKKSKTQVNKYNNIKIKMHYALL